MQIKIKIIFLELNTILVTGGSSSSRELWYFRPEAAAGQELVPLTCSLSFGRSLHTSGLLPDGKVIMVGGIGNNPTPTSEIFDPVTETVVPGPNTSQGRFAPAGTSLGDKFYACGNRGNIPHGKTCDVYDPALNNWQLSASSSEYDHDQTDLGKQSS